MEEEDYITCPSCGSPVAVVQDDFQYGEIAYCKYDCGYKWYMLIEPDPELFNEIHPFKKEFDDNENLVPTIYGHDTPIVQFEGDLEELNDLLYEDISRYNRILKYSDFNDTLLKPQDEDIPANLANKRRKFFIEIARKEAFSEKERHLQTIENFISDKDTLDNLLYVLITVCSMEIKYDDNVSKIYGKPRISCIIYHKYNLNALRDIIYLSKDNQLFEKLLETLDDFGIPLLKVPYTKEKQKTSYDNNAVKVENKQISSEKINIVNNNTTIRPDFLNKKTSYNKTVFELLQLIKDDEPISAIIQSKPYIIPLKEFYNDLENNLSIPSLIDFKNQIVFMNVSHKSIIQTLSQFILKDKDIDNIEYEKLSSLFHKHVNVLEVFTPVLNLDIPKTFTFFNKNKDNKIFFNKVSKLPFKYNTYELFNPNDFVVLNGSGQISGEVYFPKPEEEEIPKNKILIIPTASEEYFLPAISQMNGSGCIITEKGSKTSHLIINSKEFDFNIILFENASSFFQEGEYITIDFDQNKILTKSKENNNVKNLINV